MANIIFQAYELPTFDSVSGTQLIAKTEGGQMGYVNASQLQTTLDGNGLATDTDISASNAARVSLSGSVATTFKNTSFVYTLFASVIYLHFSANHSYFLYIR